MGWGGPGLPKDAPETWEGEAAGGQVGAEWRIRLGAECTLIYLHLSPLWWSVLCWWAEPHRRWKQKSFQTRRLDRDAWLLTSHGASELRARTWSLENDPDLLQTLRQELWTGASVRADVELGSRTRPVVLCLLSVL